MVSVEFMHEGQCLHFQKMAVPPSVGDEVMIPLAEPPIWRVNSRLWESETLVSCGVVASDRYDTGRDKRARP